MKVEKQPILDSTLVFHTSVATFGNELQGKLIGVQGFLTKYIFNTLLTFSLGHLHWSPMGDFLAAALDKVINIWPIKKSDETEGFDWFIEHQKEFITVMCWPRKKNEESMDKEYLLVGTIDGNCLITEVSFICQCALF